MLRAQDNLPIALSKLEFKARKIGATAKMSRQSVGQKKEEPKNQMAFGFGLSLLRWGYILGLRPFLTLCHLHSDFLAFPQCFAAGAVNCTMVYKNIFATFLLNKSKTFFIIEPLNGTYNLI
jgi:hypothetical protein